MARGRRRRGPRESARTGCDQCLLVDDFASRGVDQARAVSKRASRRARRAPPSRGSRGAWIVTMSAWAKSASSSRYSPRSVSMGRRCEYGREGRTRGHAAPLRCRSARGRGSRASSAHLLGEGAFRPGARQAPDRTPVALDHLPPRREDQGKGEVGRRLVEHARGVRDDDPRSMHAARRPGRSRRVVRDDPGPGAKVTQAKRLVCDHKALTSSRAHRAGPAPESRRRRGSSKAGPGYRRVATTLTR